MMRPGVMLFGMLLPLAVLVLVAYGFWELGRSRPDSSGAAEGVGGAGGVGWPGGVGSSAARSILDERFARGELDTEDYVRRRALLDGTVPSPPVSMAADPPPSDPAPADPAPPDPAPLDPAPSDPAT